MAKVQCRGDDRRGHSFVPNKLPDGKNPAIFLGGTSGDYNTYAAVETCNWANPTVQDFNLETKQFIWELWNPNSKSWETIATQTRDHATGAWIGGDGSFTLSDGSKMVTHLSDVTTAVPQWTTAQIATMQKAGYVVADPTKLVNTPIAYDAVKMPPSSESAIYAITGTTPAANKTFGAYQFTPPSALTDVKDAHFYDGGFRVRRKSISNGVEQNGFSPVKLWYSGQTAYVCNSLSRIQASCYYRPEVMQAPVAGVYSPGTLPSSYYYQINGDWFQPNRMSRPQNWFSTNAYFNTSLGNIPRLKWRAT